MQQPIASPLMEEPRQHGTDFWPLPDEAGDLAQQYVDIAGLILVALDAHGNIALLNRKGHEVLEHPEGSLLGKNWFRTCLPERERLRITSAFAELMAANTPTAEHFENAVVTRSGRERIIAWHNTLLRDKSGQCVGTLSSGEDITDRKRAEEMLRVSRDQLASLADNLPHTLVYQFTHDASGKRQFLYLSAATKRIFGVTPEEVKADARVLYRQILEPYREAVERAEVVSAITQVLFDQEVPLHAADGTVRWLRICSMPCPGEEGQTVWNGIATDVTDRKQTEAALAAALREWSVSFDALADGVSVHSPDHTILNANQSLCQMLGKSKEELIGKKCYQVFHGKDAPVAGCPLEKSRETLCKGDAELFEPTLNKWLAASTSPVLDDAGRLERLIHVAQDVTDRKRAEEALQHSEQRYRRLFEVESDAIVLRDCETGRFLDANAAALKLYGYSREEWPLLQVADISAEPDKTRQAIANRELHTPLRWHRKKDGTVFPVEIAGSFFECDGRAIHVAAIRDITERKRAEDALRESQRAAEAANRAKTQFLANMSHEIRTPMTAILGFADLLTSPGLAPEEQREYVQTVARNGRALMALIDDILDLSKIEAGKMAAESIACPLRQLLDDVLGVVAVRAREKGLALDVRYDGSPPETIRTDPTRLRQILVNLVGNAVKFTAQGGVHISVRHQESPDGSAHTQFAISDTGIGIAPEQLAELFQPFTQADTSTTRRFGGTGLGLAISKRLAKLLGGDIEVASELGRGSTFTVTITAAPACSIAK